MRIRSLLGIGLLALPFAGADAQVTRWNDRAQDDWSEEAPMVRIWMEGPRNLAFGGRALVRFRVEEDAYVVVGRVDSDGRLSILYPYSRTHTARVRGGEDVIVRGRSRGSYATFYAAERYGSGFVFAIASYDPLDLSRIRNADYEHALGRLASMARRYYGDPSAVVERFAPWVLYDVDSPYDYDIEYYSVGPASYASMSEFCTSGYRWYGYTNMAYGYGDFPMGYNPCRGYNSLFCTGWVGLTWLGFSPTLCHDQLYYERLQRIARGGTGTPVTPTTPNEPRPNARLIGQLGHPDTAGNKRGIFTQLEPPGRPVSTPVDGENGDDEFNRVYSIPQRALENMKRRERAPLDMPPSERNGPAAVGGNSGGADPTPVTRRGRETEGTPERTYGGRTRPGSEPAGRDRGLDRRYEPPPRETTREWTPPSRDVGGRHAPSHDSYDPPSRRFDGPRGSSSPSAGGGSYSPPRRVESGANGGGGGGGGAAASAPRSDPPPRAESPRSGEGPKPPPGSSGEKKPPQAQQQ